MKFETKVLNNENQIKNKNPTQLKPHYNKEYDNDRLLNNEKNN